MIPTDVMLEADPFTPLGNVRARFRVRVGLKERLLRLGFAIDCYDSHPTLQLANRQSHKTSTSELADATRHETPWEPERNLLGYRFRRNRLLRE